jgi:hypothetical protein
MDEHVRDVPCHPVIAVGIGNTIAFSGLNHRHLAEDADRGLINYVFENVGSAASDRRQDGRLVLSVIVKPAVPIVSHKAGHECAVRAHVGLAPTSIECEKGICKSSRSFRWRGGLREQRPERRNESERGQDGCHAREGEQSIHSRRLRKKKEGAMWIDQSA